MFRKELNALSSALRTRMELGWEDEMLPGACTASAPARFSVPSAPPSAGRGGKIEGLEAVSAKIRSCRLCPLGASRVKAVPGAGSPEPKVMFVGEGPGYEEDRRGLPFVGKAGELLDKILAAMGLSRPAVYITNVVKCHPMKVPSDPELRSNDRPPSPEEAAACRPYLEEQISILSPRAIVALGAVASRELLKTEEPLSALRGRRFDREFAGRSAAVFPTYHPAALLRRPELKREAWRDYKAVMGFLEGP